MTMVQCAHASGGYLLTIDGEFGASEARAIKDILRAVAPGSLVTLDFSQAERLHEFGMASMVQILDALKGSAVRVRGLCRHHLRILAYLGARLAGGTETSTSDEA